MMNNFNLHQCIDVVLEDITFKTCIRLEVNGFEQLIRDTFCLAGEDFNRALCLGIKINQNRGRLKLSSVRSKLY